MVQEADGASFGGQGGAESVMQQLQVAGRRQQLGRPALGRRGHSPDVGGVPPQPRRPGRRA